MILLFLPVAAAPAADPLQQFVHKVETLSARFEQVQKDEKGIVLQASSGHLWLARPGRFHWAYEKPFQQQIVCDGKTLWQYDPDLAQVMVRPAGETLQGTPAQLLTDRVALNKHFTVKSLGPDNGAQRMLLTPKSSDGDFRSIEIWLKDAVPQRMRFEDPLGGVSEVTFLDVRTNAPIEPARFRFQIPKGAEVISAQ
ncbi:MAG TPA: outer membrane lipoprotein chaperone LolA [Verrucomicrobiae bacterium]|nr:outer membrane lipoprotein chaperone LolA [Verrucomicrobiae bacterium]